MNTKETTQAEVAIDRIEVVSNFRTKKNKEKLQELVDSIKKVGVLEPILLRREGTRHILIAGARRLEAAKKAGLKWIPSRIMEVQEKEAAEIQAFENLHREDLSPLDESRSFKTLLDLGSHTVETLAARIDKSVGYVYRALKLLELPEAGIKALEAGTITPGHAHQILRAPAKQAERLIVYATTKMGWGDRTPTVEELTNEISKTVERQLDTAPFPKDIEYAGTMACAKCPFNTGNQNALFEGATKGRCTNPGCFNTKTSAFYKELQEKGKKKFEGLTFIGAQRSGYGDRIKGFPMVSPTDAKVQKALKSNPEKFGYAIVKPSQYGTGKPQLVLVCKDPALVKTREDQGYRAMTPEEQAELQFLQKTINRIVWKTVVEKVDITKELLIEILGSLTEGAWHRRVVANVLAGIGIEVPDEGDKDIAPELGKVSVQTLTKAALLALGAMGNLEASQWLSGDTAEFRQIEKNADAEARKEWKLRKAHAPSAKGGDESPAKGAAATATATK